MELKLLKLKDIIARTSKWNDEELATLTLFEINTLISTVRGIFIEIIKINLIKDEDKKFPAQLRSFQQYSNNLKVLFKLHDELKD